MRTINIIVVLIINTAALILTDYLLAGMHIQDFPTAITAAIILGLVNTFIRPILAFITAPLNFLTLGLFTFVINALMLSLTATILGAAFVIDNFWWAIFAAAVLAVVSTALSSLVKDLSAPKKKH